MHQRPVALDAGAVLAGPSAIAQSTPGGTYDFSPDLTNLPSGTIFLPGQSWNFQLWFRDTAGGGAGFNTSDGCSVTFVP